MTEDPKPVVAPPTEAPPAEALAAPATQAAAPAGAAPPTPRRAAARPGLVGAALAAIGNVVAWIFAFVVAGVFAGVFASGHVVVVGRVAMSCRVAWVPPTIGGDGLWRPGERMDEMLRSEGERAAFDESFDGDAKGVGLVGVEPQFFGDHAGLDRLVAGALHVVQHAA